MTVNFKMPPNSLESENFLKICVYNKLHKMDYFFKINHSEYRLTVGTGHALSLR